MNFESTEHATTSVFIALNSSIRSLKAIISVGQTNVLKNLRQDKSQTFMRKPVYSLLNLKRWIYHKLLQPLFLLLLQVFNQNAA